MTVYPGSMTEAWRAGRTTRRPRAGKTALMMLVSWLAVNLPTWKNARSWILQVSGLVMFDVAFWHIGMVWGMFAVGASLFVFEWLGGESK
jgi:hypothetical protein